MLAWPATLPRGKKTSRAHPNGHPLQARCLKVVAQVVQSAQVCLRWDPRPSQASTHTSAALGATAVTRLIESSSNSTLLSNIPFSFFEFPQPTLALACGQSQPSFSFPIVCCCRPLVRNLAQASYTIRLSSLDAWDYVKRPFPAGTPIIACLLRESDRTVFAHTFCVDRSRPAGEPFRRSTYRLRTRAHLPNHQNDTQFWRQKVCTNALHLS